jgi:hypothetical protein
MTNVFPRRLAVYVGTSMQSLLFSTEGLAGTFASKSTLQTRETRRWGTVSLRRMPPPRRRARAHGVSVYKPPRGSQILSRDRASKGSRFPSPRGVGSSPGRCATVAGGRGARRRPPRRRMVPGQQSGFPAPEQGGFAVAVSTITAASTWYDNPKTWFCTGTPRHSRSRPSLLAGTGQLSRERMPFASSVASKNFVKPRLLTNLLSPEILGTVMSPGKEGIRRIRRRRPEGRRCRAEGQNRVVHKAARRKTKQLREAPQ